MTTVMNAKARKNELMITKLFVELESAKKDYERLQILGVCRTFSDSKYMMFLKKEIPRLKGALHELCQRPN